MQISTSLRTLLAELRHDNRPAELLYRSFYSPNPNSYQLINPRPFGNYFTFRERTGLISYMPEGREQLFNNDGSWKRDGRAEIKPAKWLRAVLNPKIASRIPDHMFASFSEKFKAAEQASNCFFTYPAPIADAYSQDWGACITSCMIGEPVAEFYDCFNVAAIIAVNAAGQKLGRALVWKLDDGSIFQDRVYYKDGCPEIFEQFKLNAASQGWLYRDNGATIRNPDGTVHYGELVTTGSRVPDRNLFCPYIDTLRNYDGKRKLSNRRTNDSIELCDTSGAWPDNHDGEVQDIRGNWIPEEESVEVDGETYHQEDDAICYCERCEEYVRRSDCYQVEVSRRETLVICNAHVTPLG
jgi:hypothetical protein